MGSQLELVGTKQRTVWLPRNPLRIAGSLDCLQCDSEGRPTTSIQATRCLDRWPFDFVGPLRRRLQQAGLELQTFPYDWRRSLFHSASCFADWVNDRNLDTIDIIGVSTGGLIATQFARNGYGDRIRKLIAVGTPFLGMPRALMNLELGSGVNSIADFLFARKFQQLISSFPAAYEVIPGDAYRSVAPIPFINASPAVVDAEAQNSFLKSRLLISASLFDQGQRFLAELNPAETLRSVDTSYIISSAQTTPVQIDYSDSGKVRVRSDMYGDGGVPVFSQTIGGLAQQIHPGKQFEFQGPHRTLYLQRLVMERIVKELSQGSD